MKEKPIKDCLNIITKMILVMHNDKAMEVNRSYRCECTGCGQCLTPCITGALKIVNGKCRLVDESLCDGFGACISACPHDAISLEFREAEEFREEYVGKLVIATLMKRYGLVEAYIRR